MRSWSVCVILMMFLIDFGSGKIEVNVLTMKENDKKEFVDAHNFWRRKTGAVAMLPMKWNDGLAKLAQSAASTCTFAHSPPNKRQNVAGFNYIGENVYLGPAKPTPKDIVDQWALEVKYYDLDSNKCSKMCGHYTQVTWSSTTDIGCAVSSCDPMPQYGKRAYLAVCEYGPAGNIVGRKPYEIGTPGSKCLEAFKIPKGPDGLCDNGTIKWPIHSNDTKPVEIPVI